MKIFSSYKSWLLASAVLTVFGVSAIAQSLPKLPILPVVNSDDLFQDIPHGSPVIGNQYVTAAQIAGVPGFVKSVPLTGFSLTFANSQTNMILNPAGTLATGTLTTAPNPSNGQRECVLSTQTQTALTWSANTGQTIANAPTALVANVPVCMTYSSSNLTWDRSP